MSTENPIVKYWNQLPANKSFKHVFSGSSPLPLLTPEEEHGVGYSLC